MYAGSLQKQIEYAESAKCLCPLCYRDYTVRTAFYNTALILPSPQAQMLRTIPDILPIPVLQPASPTADSWEGHKDKEATPWIPKCLLKTTCSCFWTSPSPQVSSLLTSGLLPNFSALGLEPHSEPSPFHPQHSFRSCILWPFHRVHGSKMGATEGSRVYTGQQRTPRTPGFPSLLSSLIARISESTQWLRAQRPFPPFPHTFPPIITLYSWKEVFKDSAWHNMGNHRG